MGGSSGRPAEGAESSGAPVGSMADLAALTERAAAAAGRIAAALAGWDDTRLRAPAGDGAWSAAAILAHVRASDDILAVRVYMILARDEPPLPAFDERRWATVAGYAALDVRASLAVFAGRRAELVAVLRALPAEDWRRVGTSEVHGRVTIADVVRLLVEHEDEHVAQFEALAEGLGR